MSSAAPVEAILLSVPTIDSSSETVIRSPSIDVSFVNTDPTDTNGSVLSKKIIHKIIHHLRVVSLLDNPGVHTRSILFLKSISERGGSEMERF